MTAARSELPAPIPVPDRFNAADFFLDRHVREGRGGRTAFQHCGRRVTYGEVAERASRLGHALLARGVQGVVRARLAGYKAPRWVDLVPELPKTGIGKIQRFRLRKGA